MTSTADNASGAVGSAAFDAAEAAVEAALAAGARYADARLVDRRHESMSARNGDVEVLTQSESAGLGVRALVGSSWGFAALADPSGDADARRAGERAAAIAQASAPCPVRRWSWCRSRRAGQLGQRVRRGPASPSRCPRRATCSPASPRRCAAAGAAIAEALYQVWDTRKWFVSSEGAPHRPARPRVRRRHARPTAIGDGETQRRSYPAHPRPVRHPRLGAGRASSTCPAHADADRRRGAGAADRAAVPGRRDHADPRRRADGAADPRVGRARHRARPDPRLGGRVRRHLLAGPGPAGLAAVRLAS